MVGTADSKLPVQIMIDTEPCATLGTMLKQHTQSHVIHMYPTLMSHDGMLVVKPAPHPPSSKLKEEKVGSGQQTPAETPVKGPAPPTDAWLWGYCYLVLSELLSLVVSVVTSPSGLPVHENLHLHMLSLQFDYGSTLVGQWESSIGKKWPSCYESALLQTCPTLVRSFRFRLMAPSWLDRFISMSSISC